MAKYSKFKTKIHPITFIIAAIFLIVIVILAITAIPSDQDKIYNEYYQQQIRTQDFNGELLIEKDHLYKSVKVDELKNKISNDDLVIVYYGASWCPNCLNEISVYDSELRKNETLFEMSPNIFYLKKLDTEHAKGFEELAEELAFDIPVITPALLIFYQGQLVEATYVVGTQQPKDIRTAVRAFYNEVLKEIN